MSPEDLLGNKLLFELTQIRKELNVIERILGKGTEIGPDEIRIRAAAGSLHSIYNGIEKMIQLVLKDKKIFVEHSGTWHSDLLSNAKTSGVISESLETELRAYLGFRHFYRHSYGFMIDDELLNPLLVKIQNVIAQVSVEFKIEK